MEPLIVLAVTFVLLWVIFILPQQRRVRAHQALVASVEPGDQVILSAGIYGRIVDLGPEDLTLEVAPGVRLRVARQAVLRLVEDATVVSDAPPAVAPGAADRRDETVRAPGDESAAARFEAPTSEAAADAGSEGAARAGSETADDAAGSAAAADAAEAEAEADPGAGAPGVPDPDHRGPATPGPNV